MRKGLLDRIRGNFRGPGDVWVFLRTAARVAAAHRLRSRLPVLEVLRRFTPPVGPPCPEEHLEALARYVSFWLYLRVFPVRWNCWTRTLALFELLRLHGVADVTLRIGVTKHQDALHGHAWLMRGGEPFMEPPGEALNSLRVVIEHPPKEST